jgi:hypothetical protein
MQNPGGPEFIRPTDVLAIFGAGLTEQRLRQLRHQRRGPAFVKAGKTVFYRVADVARWLESCTVTPEASANP